MDIIVYVGRSMDNIVAWGSLFVALSVLKSVDLLYGQNKNGEPPGVVP